MGQRDRAEGRLLDQTGVIFFYLLIGFVVYVTLKGELRAYLQILGLA